MVAVLLLLAAACWPRSRGAQSAAELAQTARTTTTRTTAARSVTTAAKLVSAPGTAKLVVAEADPSDLTN
jgi:hypothetical protein